MVSSGFLGLSVIILAGILNASFLIPARFVRSHSGEVSWFFHAIIGLGIIPWFILFLLQPHFFNLYNALPSKVWFLLIFSGAFFGVGQLCFFNAIEKVGIALAFTINIGLGVVIGSIFTKPGMLVMLAVLLILISLIFNYMADTHQNRARGLRNNHYAMGWLLAIVAGVASGVQNIAFVSLVFWVNFPHSDHSHNFWVWPPFLLSAALVMLMGFGYRLSVSSQNSLTTQIKGFCSTRNIILVVIMGLFFTGSLVMYSQGMSMLGKALHIIGWPAFMTMIILTCRFWGKIYDKNTGILTKHPKFKYMSIVLLLLAIVVLSAVG